MTKASSPRRLFALLVDIDKYAAPVPSLQGWCQDVARIRDYLESRCAQPVETTAQHEYP